MSDPIAYFITFRTYGTWLHGDERGSTDRHHNAFGTPLLDADPSRQRSARVRLAHPPVMLQRSAREVVAMAIRQTCHQHDWTLHALNVRSNHVRVVVSAPQAPEQAMVGFKAWCTRRLREHGMVRHDAKVWSRHGSTKYIWKPEQLIEACRYTAEGQGDEAVP